MSEGNGGRLFAVLIEHRLPGNEIDRSSEWIEFEMPEALGPESTLKSIARCRVETQLLLEMATTKANKNWAIISVAEVEPV